MDQPTKSDQKEKQYYRPKYFAHISYLCALCVAQTNVTS